MTLIFMALKIYHNNKCSKSRSAHELLIQSGKPLEVVEYLTTPPTAAELEEILKLLGLPPEKIVRTGEARFQELGLDKSPPTSRDAWIQVLVANPILIERPIVTNGTCAVIGRPPERVLELI